MTQHLLAEIGHDHRLLIEAANVVTASRRVSKESFRRKMRVGFVKAGRLLDLLEQCAIVGPCQGSSGWEVLVKAEDLDAHLEKSGLTPLVGRAHAAHETRKASTS
ncbi:DNA translocase FtsK [Streptosporangium sp. NPDC048865]|uniref:DNA translocase FtsK n=1 Tax=Streptosporangium sp. NPDC048865 TaxID=3155766 RepID=UPI003436C271